LAKQETDRIFIIAVQKLIFCCHRFFEKLKQIICTYTIVSNIKQNELQGTLANVSTIYDTDGHLKIETSK